MQSFDVSSILRYGVVGLGFLLAFMAYRLLSSKHVFDQRRERAIYTFMLFSVVIIAAGIFSERSRSITLEGEDLKKRIVNIRKMLDEARVNIDHCKGFSWAASTNKCNNTGCQDRAVQAMQYGNAAMDQCSRVDAELSAISR